MALITISSSFVRTLIASVFTLLGFIVVFTLPAPKSLSGSIVGTQTAHADTPSCSGCSCRSCDSCGCSGGCNSCCTGCACDCNGGGESGNCGGGGSGCGCGGSGTTAIE